MFDHLKAIFAVPNESARHVWVESALARLPRGTSILDAGCGTQRYRSACAHLEYKAQDFGRYDGRGDERGLQCNGFAYGKLDYICDIWNIPEADATFDAVLCTEVLEHVPYPNETLRELCRILKPGGILLVTAPFASIPHMSPYYFFSGFDPNWYRYILAKVDMDIVSIEPNGNAFAFILQELLRLRREIKGRVRRFLFLTLATPLLLFLAANHRRAGDNANYLSFGQHVRAVKRGRI